ncbi:Fanconi anemia group M protein homolog isoform X3 [Biomphalaria glabrata]|nr:Fanconi anemia group M protein homolog isoform X3 [Biomphalaria glabrata]XP_055880503.1 Fanconi anemia group M protein homolog isoform X3 [Biomphalaria glabrata]XP_055880505.1 Fanconi anemia group M protein homolog isoform X3 [Biomphalaria glabrata]
MYNMYRWFPQSKVVFMAPTKPLVAQQMNACYEIMGIPTDDTIELTGSVAPPIRHKAWKEKRVVFLTPHVMINDLCRGTCLADSIKCIVVDEAHKALRNYAYCQVIKELVKYTRQFRVLALSATPGSDLKSVQEVINNLLISHIELRSENSIDIQRYTYERKIEKVVVPMGEELSGFRMQYIQVMSCVTLRLIQNNVLYNRDASKLSKFMLLKCRDEFRQNPPQTMQHAQYGNIEADFALAISLYHGFELLQIHGLKSLYNYLMGIISGDKGIGRTRSELLRNPDFNSIMEKLRQKFSDNINACNLPSDVKCQVGHPKMQCLEEIVLEHFNNFKKKSLQTRVMIFSQYRDSVQEITSILQQHHPLIRVMPFIGQASFGKSGKGYSQKEQLLVMKKFREGGYNTLVSTCVGEEGLDIGDVDLIVCFDAHKSPIRLVQRMGRTGRKREGRIVMLVTEGKEEMIYNQSVLSKKAIHKAILNSTKSLKFYQNNTNVVNPSMKPKCHKMFITVPTYSLQEKTKTLKRKKSLEKFIDFNNKRDEVSQLFHKEYSSIKEEFSIVTTLAKIVPRPKLICIDYYKKANCCSSSTSIINFCEWMPWQNILQKTFLVSHSLHSIHLVENLKFIDLQYTIGNSDDFYGLEMSRINTEKVKTIGQSSIVSFLNTSQLKVCRLDPNLANEDKTCQNTPTDKFDYQNTSDISVNFANAILVSSETQKDEKAQVKFGMDNTLKETATSQKSKKRRITKSFPINNSKIRCLSPKNTLKHKNILKKYLKDSLLQSKAGKASETQLKSKVTKPIIKKKHLELENEKVETFGTSFGKSQLGKVNITDRFTYIVTEPDLVHNFILSSPDISNVKYLFNNLKSSSDFADVDLEFIEKWKKTEKVSCEKLLTKLHNNLLLKDTSEVLEISNRKLNSSNIFKETDNEYTLLKDSHAAISPLFKSISVEKNKDIARVSTCINTTQTHSKYLSLKEKPTKRAATKFYEDIDCNDKLKLESGNAKVKPHQASNNKQALTDSLFSECLDIKQSPKLKYLENLYQNLNTTSLLSHTQAMDFLCASSCEGFLENINHSADFDQMKKICFPDYNLSVSLEKHIQAKKLTTSMSKYSNPNSTIEKFKNKLTDVSLPHCLTTEKRESINVPFSSLDHNETPLFDLGFDLKEDLISSTSGKQFLSKHLKKEVDGSHVHVDSSILANRLFTQFNDFNSVQVPIQDKSQTVIQEMYPSLVRKEVPEKVSPDTDLQKSPEPGRDFIIFNTGTSEKVTVTPVNENIGNKYSGTKKIGKPLACQSYLAKKCRLHFSEKKKHFNEKVMVSTGCRKGISLKNKSFKHITDESVENNYVDKAANLKVDIEHEEKEVKTTVKATKKLFEKTARSSLFGSVIRKELKASTPIKRHNAKSEITDVIINLTPIEKVYPRDGYQTADKMKIKMGKVDRILSTVTIHQGKKQKGKTQGNIFIEEEAELSEEHSSDESEYFDDLYDASFIDNSEVIHSIETDMHAVYLKSVRSPLLHGQFKLLYDKEKPNMDIYSQTLSEDHGNSKYEEDSFCVGNGDKDSCVTEGESSHYKFTKLSKKSERKKKRAGKRILFLCDSSSEEEDKEHVNLTEEFSVMDRQHVKKLLSSSEDEASTHMNINEHSKSKFT